MDPWNVGIAFGRIGLAYLAVPIAFFAYWFVDLWAKAYDQPRVQVVATVVLAVLVAVTAAGLVHLVGGSAGPLGFLVVATGLPVLCALVWIVHDLDWRVVYLGAMGGPLLLLGTRPLRMEATLSVLVAMSMGIVAVHAEIPRVRLARYGVQLVRGCSCCGYRDRAIHELSALGAAGEGVLRTASAARASGASPLPPCGSARSR